MQQQSVWQWLALVLTEEHCAASLLAKSGVVSVHLSQKDHNIILDPIKKGNTRIAHGRWVSKTHCLSEQLGDICRTDVCIFIHGHYSDI